MCVCVEDVSQNGVSFPFPPFSLFPFSSLAFRLDAPTLYIFHVVQLVIGKLWGDIVTGIWMLEHGIFLSLFSFQVSSVRGFLLFSSFLFSLLFRLSPFFLFSLARERGQGRER